MTKPQQTNDAAVFRQIVDLRDNVKYHRDELNCIYQQGEAIADRVAYGCKQLASPQEDLIAMLIVFYKKKRMKYCSGPLEAD
jgi:hypothetical protein